MLQEANVMIPNSPLLIRSSVQCFKQSQSPHCRDRPPHIPQEELLESPERKELLMWNYHYIKIYSKTKIYSLKTKGFARQAV